MVKKLAGTSRRVFLALELSLLVAIPLLAYTGFRTLLETRSGTFIEDPGPADPGWQALVDPSPVTAVVELSDSGSVTGIAILASLGPATPGGAAILIPGELLVGGRTLGALSPADAVEVVEELLRLDLSTVEMMDGARWSSLLGETTYTFQNPDPVPDESGEIVFEVGPVEVDGGKAALFLGRTIAGADPLASLVRRELFWAELLDNPPPLGDSPLAVQVRAIGEGPHQVIILPFHRTQGSQPTTTPDQIESVVTSVVPFPAGSANAPRIRVLLEDRTGSANLEAAASRVAASGLEVVAIANAPSFDNGITNIRISPSQPADIAEQIKALVGESVPIVTDVTLDANDPVVIQLGPDQESVLFPIGL